MRTETNSKHQFKLREIIKLEKSQMLPLNFFVSYILTPAYLVISALLLITFGVLMSIDDEKYLVAGLLCLGFFVVLSIAFLLLVPFVKKEAIRTEMQRYNLDTEIVTTLEIFDFSDDELSVKFDKHGMYIDDELYYYNHLTKYLVTHNHYKRIAIGIRFSVSEEQSITLPLDCFTLKMLQVLNIELQNQAVLDYIIANKEAAFKQIYDKGFISNI